MHGICRYVDMAQSPQTSLTPNSLQQCARVFETLPKSSTSIIFVADGLSIATCHTGSLSKFCPQAVQVAQLLAQTTTTVPIKAQLYQPYEGTWWVPSNATCCRMPHSVEKSIKQGSSAVRQYCSSPMIKVELYTGLHECQPHSTPHTFNVECHACGDSSAVDIMRPPYTIYGSKPFQMVYCTRGRQAAQRTMLEPAGTQTCN